MRTTHLLTVSRSIWWGDLSNPLLDADPLDADPPPGCRPFLDADPLPLDADPLDADSPVDRMTDACENITLPQNFVCGR